MGNENDFLQECDWENVMRSLAMYSYTRAWGRMTLSIDWAECPEGVDIQPKLHWERGAFSLSTSHHSHAQTRQTYCAKEMVPLGEAVYV